MTQENKSENPDELDKQEKPEKLIDEIVEQLEIRHRDTVDEATRIGHSLNSFKTIRPIFEKIGNTNFDDPERKEIYVTTCNSFAAYRDELRLNEDRFKALYDEVKNMPMGESLFSAAASTTSFFPEVSRSLPTPIQLVPPLDKIQSYIERFSNFDPALGNTYREIWEALYGTRADPERAALYLIRQAFDQLLDKLAPKDKVKNSLHWKEKNETQGDTVTREERIYYAANEYIKDSGRAQTLKASAEHMLVVYKNLNRAHSRKELNKEKANLALEEMRNILQDWADAIGI